MPKLLTTIVEALQGQNVSNPGRRIFLFDLLLSTATVIVKNSDFSDGEVDRLRQFARKMSFNVSYYPGMPERDKDFPAMLRQYIGQYRPVPVGEAEAEGPAGINLIPSDLYHFTLEWLLSGRKKELHEGYVFDIRPATDSRPYYTAYLKPGTIGMFLDQIGEVSEEWGYLLLLGTLLVSIVFGIVIVLIPLFGRWSDLFKGRRGTAGIIVYFACLGMGYMLVEIFLIQRLVFFLGDPIFSVSVVITSMLILSALGSLFAQRFSSNRTKIVRIAVAGIAASLLFYIFGLSPLIGAFIGLPLAAKFLLAVVFIAPAAFFMGMPFPTGLSALESNRSRLIPWALGMNGALSVTGAVVAKLVSISSGFPAVLGLAIVLYLLVGLIYRSNEA